MGMFLDTKAPMEAYRSMVADPYFVDKTALIGGLIPALGLEKRFFCITRPRRFGKSVMANMVAAFFGKAGEGEDLFHRLKISHEDGYKEHLHGHHVVFIDLSRMPRERTDYKGYIDRIQDGLLDDLSEAYPDLDLPIHGAVWDAFQQIFEKTGDRFLFVLDEWDAIFQIPTVTKEEKEDYIGFLRDLLKGQVYAELVYMTGVLPIAFSRTSCGTQRSDDLFVNASGESLQAVFPADALYSSGSGLNMFVEYDMAVSERFSEYFGF